MEDPHNEKHQYDHEAVLDGRMPNPEDLTVWYRLDGSRVKWKDLAEYSRDLWGDGEKERRNIIAQTDLAECVISTIFLGMDHSFSRNINHDDLNYKPILWETMAFGKLDDKIKLDELYMERYKSGEDAIYDHIRIVTLIKKYGLDGFLNLEEDDEEESKTE